MKRLFIGIDLPDNIKDQLLGLQDNLPGARWRPWDNLHITLRFIGEVDKHTEREIVSALDHLSAPAFDLRLKGTGQFGNKKPHTLWTGVTPEPALLHLAQKVHNAATHAGLSLDRRKYKPHVTLAYLNNVDTDKLSTFIANHSEFRSDVFSVDKYYLFRSHLGNGPSVYEKRAEFELYEAAEQFNFNA